MTQKSAEKKYRAQANLSGKGYAFVKGQMLTSAEYGKLGKNQKNKVSEVETVVEVTETNGPNK
jgi:hypothetical protein